MKVHSTYHMNRINPKKQNAHAIAWQLHHRSTSNDFEPAHLFLVFPRSSHAGTKCERWLPSSRRAHDTGGEGLKNLVSLSLFVDGTFNFENWLFLFILFVPGKPVRIKRRRIFQITFEKLNNHCIYMKHILCYRLKHLSITMWVCTYGTIDHAEAYIKNI
jgi:hypothetical protein